MSPTVCPDCGSFGEPHWCDNPSCTWRACKREACEIVLYTAKGSTIRRAKDATA